MSVTTIEPHRAPATLPAAGSPLNVVAIHDPFRA